FFFFSSRRRHTRSKRDWSSDVCSSDLTTKRKANSSTQLDITSAKCTFPKQANAKKDSSAKHKPCKGIPLIPHRIQPKTRSHKQRSEERRVGKERRKQRRENN